MNLLSLFPVLLFICFLSRIKVEVKETTEIVHVKCEVTDMTKIARVGVEKR